MRHDSSAEMTMVRPREDLPPISAPAVDIDTVETLVECEGPCKQCPCCGGDRLITEDERKAWRSIHPQGE